MKKIYSFIVMMLLSALSFTAEAATATVYIDKPEAVMFYVYDGDWNQIVLENSGDTPNIVEFNEAKTKLFEFDPYNLNTGIYKITKNDEEVMVFTGEGYEVADVKDGDVIRVQVARPADAYCIFTFEKGAEAIASVENADTEEIVPVEDGVFKAKFGDRMVLRPNTDYTITSATLNGEEMTYIPASGCYFFVVNAEKNVIVVEATPVTTAINCINTNAQSRKVYNLQGVEIKGNMPAGIYVVNGKKAVVK